LVNEVENRLGPRFDRQREEDPAAFLVAIEEASVAEDFDVAGDAGLALAKHLCELAN